MGFVFRAPMHTNRGKSEGKLCVYDTANNLLSDLVHLMALELRIPFFSLRLNSLLIIHAALRFRNAAKRDAPTYSPGLKRSARHSNRAAVARSAESIRLAARDANTLAVAVATLPERLCFCCFGAGSVVDGHVLLRSLNW